MGAFAKFLVSLVMHMIWQRVGGKGGIPPVRLPRSNKPVTIPVISTWQLMVAMWVLKKFWTQYGDQVKTRMTDAPHPIPRRIGSWLPAVDPSTSVTNAAAPASAAAAVTNAASAAATPATIPARAYNTQQLDADDDTGDNSPPARGSLLSSLRRSPSRSTS